MTKSCSFTKNGWPSEHVKRTLAPTPMCVSQSADTKPGFIYWLCQTTLSFNSSGVSTVLKSLSQFSSGKLQFLPLNLYFWVPDLLDYRELLKGSKMFRGFKLGQSLENCTSTMSLCVNSVEFPSPGPFISPEPRLQTVALVKLISQATRPTYLGSDSCWCKSVWIKVHLLIFTWLHENLWWKKYEMDHP